MRKKIEDVDMVTIEATSYINSGKFDKVKRKDIEDIFSTLKSTRDHSAFEGLMNEVLMEVLLYPRQTIDPSWIIYDYFLKR
jgi:hypothetical protein